VSAGWLDVASAEALLFKAVGLALPEFESAVESVAVDGAAELSAEATGAIASEFCGGGVAPFVCDSAA
jgi:hypothetical protein